MTPVHNGRYVSYLRVSTNRQGHDGLGIEAQREAVRRYLDKGSWQLLAEYVEVESGKVNSRPELEKARHHCKVTGARLVIAKLDRLSRDARFLLSLRDSRTKFVAADIPDATDTVVGIMAVLAEDERVRTSGRTKDALAAIKRKLAAGEVHISKAGKPVTRLGNPNGARALIATVEMKGNLAAVKALQAKAQEFAEDLRPIIVDMEIKGIKTLAALAAALDAQGVQTPRGVGKWTPTGVARVKARIEETNGRARA